MSAAFDYRRLIVPLLVIVMLAVALLTYQAKHEASLAADRVSELRHEIAQERIAISLLKAEWSELTQPGRLQDLVERYPHILALAPFGIDQMIRIGDLPMPPEEDIDVIANLLGGG